ncbi:protein translocase subunit SecD [candidate division KSB1 bacterium]
MRRDNRWRWFFIAVCIITAIYYLLPTFRFYNLSEADKNDPNKKELVNELSRDAIKRGLDLQGGVHLIMEIDLASLVEKLSVNKDQRFDDLFDSVKDRIENENPEEDFLNIFAADAQAADVPLDRYFDRDARLDENNNLRSIPDYLRNEADDAIKRSLEILRGRVDQFGVAEPNIQKKGNNRVIVELAGIDDIERAKQLIQKTARLEFKLLKSGEVVDEVFDEFDRILRNELKDKTAAAETKTEVDTAQTEKAVSTMTEKSIGDLFDTGDSTASQEEDSTVIFDENTINSTPFRAFLGDLSAYQGWVGVPAQNVDRIKLLLERDDFQEAIPSDAVFHWDAKPQVIGDGSEYYELYLLERDAALGGEVVTDARVEIGSGYDPTTAGKPEVTMKMDRQGAKDWETITGANIDKRIAIVLDDKVWSAPNVRDKITGGSSEITGIGTWDEAKDLEIVLRSGSFSVDMLTVFEQRVGPSLGADSIRKGTLSTIIGLILVVLFMITYYGLSGGIANIALLLNLIFIMSVLAGFHATLTLPGIAGLILTIGMAVDANVLIFERIREELDTGKTIRAAIDSGYSRAFFTILDANITTLIAAVVLYQYGTGPIKGFALVLMIGICSSMFTAIVFTRVIFDFVTSRWSIQKLSI